MTPSQLGRFAEIRRLLAEAYAHYNDVHKIADGLCEVSYPTAYGDEGHGCGSVEACSLMIYSYALGPYRQHHFTAGAPLQRDNIWQSPDPFETALRVVRIWHVRAMRRDEDEDIGEEEFDRAVLA